MEILNRNQRRSALWRLNALGFFILSLVIVVLLSMCEGYSSNGKEDFDKLQKEYQEAQQNWDAEKSDLKTQNAKLKEQLKACQEGKEDPNEVIETLRARIEAKDDEIETLNRTLTRCENQLSQYN